jgi:hypothetical protein
VQLESKVMNIQTPKDIQRKYELSGLGGSGELALTFADADEKFFIHVKCTAAFPLIRGFHFEALAEWEKTREGLSFVSYEEKDFTKEILKKWEFGSDGLNFIENKKGLVLEREVTYLNNPADQSMIFDPLSAATVALFERKDRDICIFGKQRILHVKTKKNNGELRVEAISGVNKMWTKILNRAEIKLNSKNIIDGVTIPTPLGMGKIRMDFNSENAIDTKAIEKILKEFHREF